MEGVIRIPWRTVSSRGFRVVVPPDQSQRFGSWRRHAPSPEWSTLIVVGEDDVANGWVPPDGPVLWGSMGEYEIDPATVDQLKKIRAIGSAYTVFFLPAASLPRCAYLRPRLQVVERVADVGRVRWRRCDRGRFDARTRPLRGRAVCSSGPRCCAGATPPWRSCYGGPSPLRRASSG
jgi:hypothetical protein